MNHFNLVYIQWENPLEIVGQENNVFRIFKENVILLTMYNEEDQCIF